MGASTWWMVFGKKELRIAVAGLAIAGKTSIINNLKLGQLIPTQPTVGLAIETVTHNNFNLVIFDYTDAQRADPEHILWKHISHSAQGFVFVVDSSDTDRITEAKDKLYTLLTQVRDEVPLLVFGNKQDLPDAMSTLDITLQFELHSLHPRLWHVQAAFAVTGQGLHQGMDWLCTKIPN